MKPHRAFIGAGSNIGNRLAYLQEACSRLNAHSGLQVTAMSPVYRSEPLGITEQPEFLNMVIQVSTSLTPHEILRCCSEIELGLGRPADHVKWGPRVLDLDLLFYDELIVDTPDLTVPHPLMQERKFVLLPLLDLANPLHPVLHTTVRELLDICPDRSSVVRTDLKLKNPS